MLRMSIALIAGLLAGCAGTPKPTSGSGPAPGSPALPAAHGVETRVIPMGGSTTLPDRSRLTYVRVLNDSRCPPDVQCVWAGDAEILLQWRATGDARVHEATLHTSTLQGRATEARLGPHRVRLQALERGSSPAATLRIGAP